jgi:hypothetical protein
LWEGGKANLKVAFQQILEADEKLSHMPVWWNSILGQVKREGEILSLVWRPLAALQPHLAPSEAQSTWPLLSALMQQILGL